ncbi:alpha/beta fold hydrolase [Haloarchaeobius sp. TZWWS8]|uniref:alpha/beta fold hydrolase n=1 Tax=Haloarchaeobius sp. TZWWS8 TaxID=3446121 RepID=UPI003EBE5188
MIPAADTGTFADHQFVRSGDGSRVLLVVPGLNDPLYTVAGSWWFARLMAAYLGRYGDTHTAYMVSRPHGLATGSTTGDMARGYEAVLDELCDRESVETVDVLGLSMGGFIVQHLAARDDRVRRAVLGLSAAQLSDEGATVVRRWRALAARGRWGPIYREAYGIVADGALARSLQAGAVVYDLFSEPTEPADFLTSADACLAHDGRDLLGDIRCPTLVLGGDEDVFFTTEAYRETAATLPEGTLAMLRGAGHESLIEYPRAFDGCITRFLTG